MTDHDEWHRMVYYYLYTKDEHGGESEVMGPDWFLEDWVRTIDPEPDTSEEDYDRAMEVVALQ